jgi:hypothetical protein
VGVFRGGYSKFGVLRVVFCGENVVECVVKLVRCSSLFEDEKYATSGRYFFGLLRRSDGQLGQTGKARGFGWSLVAKTKTKAKADGARRFIGVR